LSNLPPNPEPGKNLPPDRWGHLTFYERRYLQDAIKVYDAIVDRVDDIDQIANRYQLDIEDVRRAKDYAFGSGVSLYEFAPDSRMAEAWVRMASGTETAIDEILLRHEILESYLVSQGMNQPDAHTLTQQRYPWSILITQRPNQ
jgi:hypothetical protein